MRTTVGTVGVAFGVVYLWRRSLVASATMHFLLDAVAIIVVPLVLRSAVGGHRCRGRPKRRSRARMQAMGLSTQGPIAPRPLVAARPPVEEVKE